MTTILSSKGQIVIPAAIREKHRFRVGDELLIEDRDNEIILKKAHPHRKKKLVQWMLDCPADDLKIESLRDRPKNIKF
ncbi:MAG TPA: AbrB/MazE/SpoVT family DNA-binding domain-containing protein [Candidatus Sulfotelmatobacter sp.]|nr:AbrB/MazE/SpoVT family DNA-binding domain-containing protein [Candidatus Sulfotelmatobacter sp.]